MSTALTSVGNNNMTLAGDAFSNPAVYEHVKNLAGLLANGAFTPKHLVSPNNNPRTIATCMRVAIQALRWEMDMFAVADETYEVHGRLGYQGKLIIAVVNARAKLKGRLQFKYSGTGEQLTVTVTGQFADEDAPRSITLSVAQAKTTNDMWKKDPEQKLAYSGAIKWARRNCPELVMGVRTVEDLESMEVDAQQPKRISTLDELAEKIDPTEADPPSTEGESSQEEDGSLLEPANPKFAAWAEQFSQCDSKLACNETATKLMAVANGDAELDEIVRLKKARLDFIDANRGERSNQKSLVS